MSWTHYLFGFSGRINRAKYWLFVLVGFLFMGAGFLAVLPYILIERPSTSDLHQSVSPLKLLTLIAEGIVILAYIVASFAILVKRLHDRNKSGWWLLIFFVLPSAFDAINDPKIVPTWHIPPISSLALVLASVVLSIWGFFEIALLRGTAGDNRFGADPLAQAA